MEQLLPWLRLHLTPGLGRSALIRLIEHYGSPDDALAATPRGWPRLPHLRRGMAALVPAPDDDRVTQAQRAIERVDGWIRTLWHDDYPELLRHIADPPALLYGCGQLAAGPTLGIVGTRRPTDFGRGFTEQLARELALAGVTVISGLARGIDSAAHRGALAGRGRTIAVLGCGIDRVYPPENADLYLEIVDRGALLTEYPPGSEPLPGHFPGRNRIISGLSNALLVVEASRDSGSLITAEFALEQGREVMAVPGGIDRPGSYGPNTLIKQGAHPVTEAAEVLQLIGLDGTRARHPGGPSAPPEDLDGVALKVHEKLDLTPRYSDELAGECGLTPMELSAILLHLELLGYAQKLPGGRYVSAPRSDRFNF
jgi:DNA processing protein